MKKTLMSKLLQITPIVNTISLSAVMWATGTMIGTDRALKQIDTPEYREASLEEQQKISADIRGSAYRFYVVPALIACSAGFGLSWLERRQKNKLEEESKRSRLSYK